MARYNESTNSQFPERIVGNLGDMKGFRHFGDNVAGQIVAARLQGFNATTLAYQDVTVDNATGGVLTSGGTASDGAILDGVSGAIKATVFDFTASNPLAVRLTDTNGDYAAAGGGTQYTEDAVSAADPVGTQLISRRRDALSGTEVSADGDVIAVNSTGKGELYVKHADAVPVTDNAGSLTVDNPSLSVVGGGVEATAVRVTLASDSTGLVSVDDNGGSLTVDGAVSVTGAVDTELPAAVLMADNLALPTAPIVGAGNLVYDGTNLDLQRGGTGDAAGATGFANVLGMVFNGTTHDRMRGDTTNGLDVDVTRLPALVAGTANIGDVDVLTLPALPAGTNNIGDVDVLTLPALVAGSANIGDVDVASFAAGAITEVQGDVAHDAAAAGNPVLVGARANANEPAVVADADSTHLWADLFGRLVVLPGHPSPEAPVTVNATAINTTTVVAAPGASLSLYICKGSVHNRGSVNNLVDLRDGAAGTVRWRAELLSEGGGSLFDFGERGWKLTANTLLAVNLTAAGDVDVNVTSYYIAA